MTRSPISILVYIGLALCLGLAPGCKEKTTETVIVPYVPTILVTGVGPSRGLPAGGTTVTVYGQRFESGATVTFGTTAATGVTFVDATLITCDVPGGLSGAVDVTVANPGGESDTLAAAYTYDGTAPFDVTGFTATADDEQISLAWTNPGDADFEHVEVRRSTTANPASTSDGIAVYRGPGELYVDDDLMNGVTYYYTAFSVDDLGNTSSGAATAQDSEMPVLPPDVTAWEAVFDHQAAGGTVLFRAEADDSDGDVVSVTIDLSAVGGSSTQEMNDDGENGDETADDGVYSCLFQIPGSASLGYYQPTIWATDDHGGTTSETTDLDVTDFILAYANKTVSKGVPPGASAMNQDFCRNNNDIYVVWEDTRNGDSDIYFNCSHNGGKTWQNTDTRLDMAVSGVYSGSPKIACSGESVYVVWLDDRNSTTNHDVYMRWTSNGGQWWTAGETRVNQNSMGTSNASYANVAVSGEMVYVTWTDDRNGDLDIFFNTSHDGGWTWMYTAAPADRRLDTDFSGSRQWRSKICCDGELVYVSWVDDRSGNDDLYFTSSQDGGGTFMAVGDIQVNSGSSTFCSSAKLACWGNTVYMVWADDRNSGNAYDIFCDWSTNFGQSWQSTDAQVNASNSGECYRPWLSASADDLYVVWEEDNGTDHDIYMNSSSDGGATWGASDVRVDNGSGSGDDSTYPQVVAFGRRVYVTWLDDRESSTGTQDVYFNYSLDGGANWEVTGSDIRINSSLAGTYDASNNHFMTPRMLADSNDVRFVWLDNRDGVDKLFFEWGRHQWSPVLGTTDVRVDNASAGTAPVNAVMCRSGKNVYVSWAEAQDGTNTHVWFNASYDNGATWQTTDTLLSTSGASANTADKVQMVARGSYVYVAWQDGKAGNDDIYVIRSHDCGKTWPPAETQLDTLAGTCTMGNMAVTGDRVYVVWHGDQTGVNHVWVNYTTDGGVSWQATETQLDSGAGPATSPQVACSGNTICVVWADDRSTSKDIYRSVSQDGGTTWWGDMRVDTDNPVSGNSSSPRIAMHGRHIHVVWTDDRNTGTDIYYNCSPDGGGMFMNEGRLNTDPVGLNQSWDGRVWISGSSVYATWSDNRTGKNEGRMNISLYNGQSWFGSDLYVPTKTPGVSDCGETWLSVQGNTVIIAWVDERNSASGNVFMNYSINGGLNWETSDSQVDGATGHSSMGGGLVLFDGAHVIFGWMDDRNGAGNLDLFCNSLK